MPLSNRRKGFTLVELLVVISIIALLIGILIPAIGQARLTARLTIDQSNLRQHGIGAFNYAGDHQDDMPNLDRGSGNTGFGGATTGSATRPMGAWGNTVAPVNGLAMTGDPLLHGDIWKMYHFGFGEYIVDSANGIGMLNNVFLSAFHGGRRNTWDELSQTGDPEIPAFPNGYKLAGSSGSYLNSPLLKPPGTDPPDDFADAGNAYYLQPSWRYTLVAVLGNREPSLSNPGGQLFWGASTQQGSGGPNNTSAWGRDIEWRLFRQYIKKSSFRVPTEKVMFWDPYSFSTNAPAYCYSNAVIPSVMVDGSSRVIRPIDDVLDTTDADETKAISDAFKSGDYVSTHFRFNAVDGFLPVGQRPAWFVSGIWGVETRDIGGKGGLEDDD